jgi:hypothetical protein
MRCQVKLDPDSEAALIFRYRVRKTLSFSNRTAYCGYWFGVSTHPKGSNGNFKRFRLADPDETIASANIPPLEPNRWHDVQAVLNGRKFSYSINGVQINQFDEQENADTMYFREGFVLLHLAYGTARFRKIAFLAEPTALAKLLAP